MSGAAINGVFLDVEITACNQLKVTRKDKDGNLAPATDGVDAVMFGSAPAGMIVATTLRTSK